MTVPTIIYFKNLFIPKLLLIALDTFPFPAYRPTQSLFYILFSHVEGKSCASAKVIGADNSGTVPPL